MCEGALRLPQAKSRLQLSGCEKDKTLVLKSHHHQPGKVCRFQTEMLDISRVVSVSLHVLPPGPFARNTATQALSLSSHHRESKPLDLTQSFFFFFFGLAPNVTTSSFLFFYHSFCYNAGTFESCFKCLIESFRYWKMESISAG